jgi:hypothetical protein
MHGTAVPVPVGVGDDKHSLFGGLEDVGKLLPDLGEGEGQG